MRRGPLDHKSEQFGAEMGKTLQIRNRSRNVEQKTDTALWPVFVVEIVWRRQCQVANLNLSSNISTETKFG